MPLRIAAEVAAAVTAERPVVALESTLIAHGLPRPENLAVAGELESTIRGAGAVPATVALVAGVATVGLDADELRGVATRDDVTKVSVRDVATVAAAGGWGATTVASTAQLAHQAGIRVFATGGLGGVHRMARQTWDESADLTTLGRIPMVVVCAGVKSILDVPATWERLETLNIAVVGYGTDRFPGFYLADTGIDVTRVDRPEQVARIVQERRSLGLPEALIVAQPLPPDHAMPPQRHDEVLQEGLTRAAAAGVVGKQVTPFLLAHFHEQTGGDSLRANIALVRQNAELAARIAGCLAGDGVRP
jgi:pseudouridylate synthase